VKKPVGSKEAPGGSEEAANVTGKLLGSLTKARKLTRDDTVVPTYDWTDRFGPAVRKTVRDACAWLPGAEAVRVTTRSVDAALGVTVKLTVANPFPTVTPLGVVRIVSLGMRLISRGALTGAFIVTTQLATSDILILSGEHVRDET
jgi:hypothetical protein